MTLKYLIRCVTFKRNLICLHYRFVYNILKKTLNNGPRCPVSKTGTLRLNFQVNFNAIIFSSAQFAK